MHLSKFLLSFLFFVFTVCNFFSLLNQKKNSPFCFLFVCFCFVNFISWRLRESLTVGLNLNRVKRFFICRYFFFPFLVRHLQLPLCCVCIACPRKVVYIHRKKNKGHPREKQRNPFNWPFKNPTIPDDVDPLNKNAGREEKKKKDVLLLS